MNIKRTVLLRAIAGELSEHERQELDSALLSDPELAAELRRLQQLQGIINDVPTPGFASGFTDRVMQSISAIPTISRNTLSDALASVFFRLAPASLAVAIVIAAINIATSTIPNQSPVEAAIGLRPKASLVDIYQGMMMQPQSNPDARDNSTE